MNNELKEKLISRIKAVKNKPDLKTLLSNAVRLYGKIEDTDILRSVAEAQAEFARETAAARKPPIIQRRLPKE